MLPYAEPYKIKMVEAMHPSTAEEREAWTRTASYNLFNLKSDQVFIDLLTDSGTGAMSQEQLSGQFIGDEAYAGSRNFENLQAAVAQVFGHTYLCPTHNILGSVNLVVSTMVPSASITASPRRASCWVRPSGVWGAA